MSRIGKAEAWRDAHGATGAIARLPRAIREQLNRQLADGEQGIRLVAWLNQLPEVKTVLDKDFEGRPITEQNLSDWRQGGYEEWLSHEEARVWAAQMAEEYEDLARESGEISLPERAAYPALMALHALIHRDLIATDPEVQRRSIIQGCHQLTQLRRACLQAERLRFDKQRWEAEQQKERDRNAHRAEMRRMEQERLQGYREEARKDAQMREVFYSDLPFDIAAGLYGPPPEINPFAPKPTTPTKPTPPKPAAKPKQHPPAARRKSTDSAAHRPASAPHRSSVEARTTLGRPLPRSTAPKSAARRARCFRQKIHRRKSRFPAPKPAAAATPSVARGAAAPDLRSSTPIVSNRAKSPPESDRNTPTPRLAGSLRPAPALPKVFARSAVECGASSRRFPHPPK